MLKTIQVHSEKSCANFNVRKLLKSAGIKKIHRGWYSLWYDGMIPNSYNVVKAKRNFGGKIKQ